jgi:predicted component of type VI protein secretion system
MIYSGAQRLREPLEGARPPRPQAQRALLAVGGQRLILPPEGGVIGRSRDCAVVLDDSGVSRQHAEVRPSAAGWTVADLRSTNGVLLNGRALRGKQPLASGDRLELGSTQLVFELQ